MVDKKNQQMNTLPAKHIIQLSLALVCLLVMFFNASYAQSPNRNFFYPVTDFGAVATKDSISTIAIQRAIDACAMAGGGTVYFGPGQYTAGQIYLKSNVNIHLEAGAVLYASVNPDHYKKPKGNYEADDQINSPNEACLFFADSVSNVSFTGKGKINGQAQHIWNDLQKVDLFIEKEILNAKAAGIAMQRFYAKDPKVRLVFINLAKDITLRDITLEDSPDWGLHIGNATNVLIDGINVLSSLEKGVNSDGIDIDGCKNVRISNCNIATGDDAICLKSTLRNGHYSSCENIVINNCTLVSTSTALKIGTESHGDFRDIIFSNCTIRNSNRGISIVVRDGATVENILFTNLFIECNRKHFNWWGDGDPIRFILLKRNPDSRLGAIRNIYVKNVVATGQGTSLIKGFEGKPLENIVLDNVTLMLQPESLQDKRSTAIIQIETSNRVSIRDATLGWDKGVEKAWTFGIAAKGVNGLTLDNIQWVNPISKTALIQLSAVSNLVTGGTFNPNKWIIRK